MLTAKTSVKRSDVNFGVEYVYVFLHTAKSYYIYSDSRICIPIRAISTCISARLYAGITPKVHQMRENILNDSVLRALECRYILGTYIESNWDCWKIMWIREWIG